MVVTTQTKLLTEPFTVVLIVFCWMMNWWIFVQLNSFGALNNFRYWTISKTRYGGHFTFHHNWTVEVNCSVFHTNLTFITVLVPEHFSNMEPTQEALWRPFWVTFWCKICGIIQLWEKVKWPPCPTIFSFSPKYHKVSLNRHLDECADYGAQRLLCMT